MADISAYCRKLATLEPSGLDQCVADELTPSNPGEPRVAIYYNYERLEKSDSDFFFTLAKYNIEVRPLLASGDDEHVIGGFIIKRDGGLYIVRDVRSVIQAGGSAIIHIKHVLGSPIGVKIDVQDPSPSVLAAIAVRKKSESAVSPSRWFTGINSGYALSNMGINMPRQGQVNLRLGGMRFSGAQLNLEQGYYFVVQKKETGIRFGVSGTLGVHKMSMAVKHDNPIEMEKYSAGLNCITDGFFKDIVFSVIFGYGLSLWSVQNRVTETSSQFLGGIYTQMALELRGGYRIGQNLDAILGFSIADERKRGEELPTIGGFSLAFNAGLRVHY